MSNDYNDPDELDYPPYLASPERRAERLNNAQLRRMAANQTIERQHKGRVSIYGTVGALIALAALGFVVALCVATAATVARP